MSEFEDRINSVLGDPAQMEKITQMAKSLMGGEDAPQKSPGLPDIDPKLFTRLSSLMSAGGGENSRRQALLEAMRPYLSEKRRTKMDRALQLARFARLARIAMNEMGDEGNG